MGFMDVMIIGSGGREHALLKACLASPLANRVIAAPGNAGMAAEAECFPLSVEDVKGAVALATQEKVDLVIIGPEVPLSLGMADAIRAAGILVYGPDKEEAQLEGSKAFCKRFLERYEIPTAASRTFARSQTTAALDYLETLSLPIVVKASGLAAGKGVIIAKTRKEAEHAVMDMHSGELFGNAGDEVVIEEFLDGEEASITLMVCGDRYVQLPAAQDHKRVGEGDTGPNTGGMGCYAPASVASGEMEERIRKEIIEPTMNGFREEGFDFRGTLFIGVMITRSGPKVLEFNVRFGDPETQVVLPLLENDPLEIMRDCANGSLNPADVRVRPSFAINVVLAAKGYPGAYSKGDLIKLPQDLPPGCSIVHAGTGSDSNGNFISAGGRVLGVTAFGDTLAQAAEAAYKVVDAIEWNNKYFRRDIGHRQLKRE